MTLADLNLMDEEQVLEELFKCLGSKKWCQRVLHRRPFMSISELTSYAELAWMDCNEEDWMEAFNQHPKIGDVKDLEEKFPSTKDLAASEQSGVADATTETLTALKDRNEAYENKFGYIFIVMATGKGAGEMLGLLNERMENDPEKELKIAVHEQAKITKLRLEKLLS